VIAEALDAAGEREGRLKAALLRCLGEEDEAAPAAPEVDAAAVGTAGEARKRGRAATAPAKRSKR
jgi:hypothetical protein